MQGTGKNVFVGLSGGVDSSVAAVRLIAQGYNVVGVFIKVWHPDFMVCNWEQERLDAMRVAAHLGIPFLTCDAQAAYRDDVAHYFIEEYRAGRTPNPDVMCNQHVKFGRFLDWAIEKGADYIATGHYAQKKEPTPVRGLASNKLIPHSTRQDLELAELHRGVDTGKDQTYFLWTLSNQQLERSLFPVGDTPKEQIRAEAEAAGIPVAAKKDSQGICFLGHVDIPDFLSHYIDLEVGDVLNTSGEVIGSHKGSLVYTLGQRHGFTIFAADTNRTPHYVIATDIASNTLTVAAQPPESKEKTALTLESISLRQPLKVGQPIEFQIRYRQTPIDAIVTALTADSIKITPVSPIEQPAKGQSCVLYLGPLCIGGGIIA